MSNGETASLPEVRPAAPPPPVSSRYGEWLFRAAILVAVLGAVVVIGWSFGKVYLPRQKQARELIVQVERLSSQVDNLDRQWSKAAAEQMTNQLRRADAKLFAGRADLEAWLTDAKEKAAALALDLRADLGQPVPQTAGGRTFALIPATVSVEARPARPGQSPASPYQRLLLLCQRLTDEDKPRADLTELTVAGGTNSVTRTVLVFNCWTGKEVKP